MLHQYAQLSTSGMVPLCLMLPSPACDSLNNEMLVRNRAEIQLLAPKKLDGSKSPRNSCQNIVWVIQLEIFRAAGIDNLPEFSKNCTKVPEGPELGLLNSLRGYGGDCFSQLKWIHLKIQQNAISHGKSRLIHGEGHIFGSVTENFRLTLSARPEQSKSDF